jgi:hypothetical protein
VDPAIPIFEDLDKSENFLFKQKNNKRRHFNLNEEFLTTFNKNCCGNFSSGMKNSLIKAETKFETKEESKSNNWQNESCENRLSITFSNEKKV